MNPETIDQPDQLDPAEFDINDWLTPEDDKKHRRRETVTVYKGPDLSEQIRELEVERNRLEVQQVAQEEGAADLAVGETIDFTDLEARETHLQARIRTARVDLTIVGMIQPEVDALTRNIPKDDAMWDYTLLAESVEFPGGKKLTPPNRWAQFRNTIGEGQYQLIVQAWSKAAYGTPKVTARFRR